MAIVVFPVMPTCPVFALLNQQHVLLTNHTFNEPLLCVCVCLCHVENDVVSVKQRRTIQGSQRPRMLFGMVVLQGGWLETREEPHTNAHSHSDKCDVMVHSRDDDLSRSMCVDHTMVIGMKTGIGKNGSDLVSLVF